MAVERSCADGYRRVAPVIVSPVEMTRQLPGLDELRIEIDRIDHEILGLLAERVSAVIRVGEYKRARGLPIYDPERERSILARIGGSAPPPLDAETARNIFERVIDECRRVEQHYVQRR